MQQEAEQQLLPPPLLFCLWSWELGSGKFSRGTRCITDVFPKGSPSAPSVTLLCKKRPWYISRKISALATASSAQSSGQFSNTCCAMSPAESLGLNRNSFVFPLTRMRRRFSLSEGIFRELIVDAGVVAMMIMMRRRRIQRPCFFFQIEIKGARTILRLCQEKVVKKKQTTNNNNTLFSFFNRREK